MRYRNKPSEVEAIQFTGNAFVRDFWREGTEIRQGELFLLAGKDGAQGWVPVPVGHWIVRAPGDLTDHWPVDPDNFASKYEPVPNA